MRLWHYELLSYLPNSQLLSQKRECDLIWKDIANGKKTNHILINYIWEYEDYLKQLNIYYVLLKKEFEMRGIKFNPKHTMLKLDLVESYCSVSQPFKYHHNDRYLLQCFYNLQEKYDRGQKDFDMWTYRKLEKFIREKFCYNKKGLE